MVEMKPSKSKPKEDQTELLNSTVSTEFQSEDIRKCSVWCMFMLFSYGITLGLFWTALPKIILRKTYAYLKCKVIDNEAYFFNAKIICMPIYNLLVLGYITVLDTTWLHVFSFYEIPTH
ncbi:unnamed protein product [Meganyctiphanes norvegica]|uniref:Uncharacterized protein n=1 Tax=Meganyctiphanes norvegica TaxID=48144 RepID=A0AAV2RJ61_MEGNR